MKRTIWTLVSFFCLACGPTDHRTPPPGGRCVSECGVVLLEPAPNSWTCDAWQQFEDEWFITLDLVHDRRFTAACERVEGTRVEVQTERIEIDGKTYPATTECYINTELGYRVAPADIQLYAYAAPFIGEVRVPWWVLGHELGHVVQDCKPLPPEDPTDLQHSNWGRDGLWDQQNQEDADFYKTFNR